MRFCLEWSIRAPVTNMFGVLDPTTGKGAALFYVLLGQCPSDAPCALCTFKRTWVLILQAPTRVSVVFITKRTAQVQKCSHHRCPVWSRLHARLWSGALQALGLHPNIPQPLRCWLPSHLRCWEPSQLEWVKSLLVLMVRMINMELWIK